MSSEKYLPDIDDFFERIDHGAPVSIGNFDDIVETICEKTTLNKFQAELVLRLYFQEIRNAIVRGEKVTIRLFGNLFVTSPKTSGSKRQVFVKFGPSKSLIRKLNGKKP